MSDLASFKRLGKETLGSAPGQPAYVVPSQYAARVSEILFCNSDTAPHTVSVWASATGTTVGSGDLILSSMALVGGETKAIGLDTALLAGERLYGAADVAGFVNMRVSGWELPV
jgi:hypothetical protein